MAGYIPTPKKIIKHDYLCLLLIVGGSMFWLTCFIMTALTSYAGLDPLFALVFFAIGMVMLIIGPPLIYRQLNRVKYMFGSGIPVTGSCIRTRLYRDHICVYYQYQYAGKVHKDRQHIAGYAFGLKLSEGDPVELLVDPADPSFALLRDVWPE